MESVCSATDGGASQWPRCHHGGEINFESVERQQVTDALSKDHPQKHHHQVDESKGWIDWSRQVTDETNGRIDGSNGHGSLRGHAKGHASQECHGR